MTDDPPAGRTAARDSATRGAAVRGAVALFVLGMTGVVALAIHSVPTLRSIPELAVLSYPTLVLLAAANSTLLLVVFVGLGTGTAPRTGLHSHVFAWASGGTPDWSEFRRSLPLALGTGAVLFVIVVGLDIAFAPFTGLASGEAVTDAAAFEELIASIPMRLLYGGITEEILLRWGVMAPVAFGVGHLPALASTIGFTTALVVRTVLLNAVVGVALGWLFWRRSLETAMVAHAAFHVVLVGVSAVGMLLF